jgi:hypothetical protein
MEIAPNRGLHELGVRMTIGARMRILAGLRADIDLAESDARAILELLGSARLSVESHGDSFCAGLLDQCATQLRERHGLSGTQQSGDPVWAESNLPALIHLLIYVQAEVAETLRDTQCAAALGRCIDRLLQTHRPQPEELRPVTAH